MQFNTHTHAKYLTFLKVHSVFQEQMVFHRFWAQSRESTMVVELERRAWRFCSWELFCSPPLVGRNGIMKLSLQLLNVLRTSIKPCTSQVCFCFSVMFAFWILNYRPLNHIPIMLRRMASSQNVAPLLAKIINAPHIIATDISINIVLI